MTILYKVNAIINMYAWVVFNQIDLETTRDAQTLYSECYHKYVCMGCIQSNCLYGLFPVKLFSSDKGYNHTVHSECHHKDVYWVISNQSVTGTTKDDHAICMECHHKDVCMSFIHSYCFSIKKGDHSL